MVVQVTLLGVLIIGARFDRLLWQHALEQVLGVFARVVDLHLVNLSVALDIRRWTNDFFRALSKIVRKVLSSRHVPFLKLVLLHAVSNEQVVWNTALVELNIILEVFVLLLVQQVLLSSLGNVVVVQ